MAVYVGVDVGGTNLTAGLVDDRCRILARAGRKTPKDGTLCRAILDLAREVTAAAGARPEAPYEGAGFDDEMLVLCDCPGRLLDLLLQSFRRHKVAPVRLKAVLTPTNRGWDSTALHAELCREREAIRAGQAAVHPAEPR